jgi:hypothetical protein
MSEMQFGGGSELYAVAANDFTGANPVLIQQD